MTWHWLRHDWGKWGRVAGRVRNTYFGAAYGEWREAALQKRECKTCGIQQIRNLEEDLA